MKYVGTRRFAIVGDPVMHSLSPAIHNAGFAAYDVDATYSFLPTPRGEFHAVVARLRGGELAGVNVTMPHKENAFAAVDDMDSVAERSRAVNTIIVDDEDLIGFNTDVDGVVEAAALAGLSDRAPVLVLGAGGAGAAAAIAMERRPLFVSARDAAAAHALVERTGVDAAVVTWGEGVDGAVVINATPLGMAGEELPRDVLMAGSGLLDMAYGHGLTRACAWYRDHDRPYADGLDMLVAQAGSAFELFTGITPDLNIFRSAVQTA